MEEQWSKVVGMGELGEGYWISSYGRVFSTKSGVPKRKKTFITTCGYEYVSLCNKGYSKDIGVHVLVALAFVDKEGRDKGLEVNHKDLNKENNHVENLEWVTHQENMQHQANHYHPKMVKRCPICGKEIYGKATHCLDCNGRIHRKVNITKDELKQELLSRNLEDIGKRYSVNGNSVRKWCKRFGIPYDASTLKNTSDEGILSENWNDMLEYNKAQERIREETRKANREKNSPKKVSMIDLVTNKVIKEFDCIADAGRYLGIKPVHIPDVCKGKRKQAYGYFWKYI